MENKVFYIQSGQSFIEALAFGLKERVNNTDGYSKTKVFLPTEKSKISFKRVLVEKLKIDNKNLPDIISLGEFSSEENNDFLLKNNLNIEFEKKERQKIANLISEINRSVLLSKLIYQWKLHQGRKDDDIKNLLDLSKQLGRLLDETDINQFNENNLTKIIPNDLAFHWREVGSFLNIIIQSWPKIAKENNIVSKSDNYYYTIENLIKVWKENPPSDNIIIAGSTGSVPVTRNLIQFVSNLPNGFVIIPGLDKCLDSDGWKYVDETHPQYNIKSLLSNINVNRDNIIKWNKDSNLINIDRDLLVSQIMIPLEKIENWRKYNISNYNLNRFFRISCNSENEESRIISAIIDKTFKKTKKSIALVTSNKNLVRRVVLELKKRKIKEINLPNDNLTNTLEGNFILITAKFLSENFSILNLLSMLKHKLSFPNDKEIHISSIEYFEKKYLRKPFPINSIEQIISLINEEKISDSEYESIPYHSEFCFWMKDNLNILLDFRKKFNNSENNIKKLFKYNIDLVNWLNLNSDFFCLSSNTISINSKLEENIIKLNIVLSKISDAELINKKNYTEFLFKIFNTITEEKNFQNEYRVNIWTPFESRLHKADVVILSDLNEDSWPSLKEISPWLSLNISKKLGINIDQKKISLLAHDFVQNLCSSEVYLTRSMIKNGKQTSPSRWLTRINNLIGLPGEEEKKRESEIKYLANSFYTPDNYIETHAPVVCPPLLYRPRTLSISDIDLLINNPYAVYMKKILKIQPLNSIIFDPDVSKQGQFIHKALDTFAKEVSKIGIEPSIKNLLNVGINLLGTKISDPVISSFWWPRFEEIASWCINNQRNIFEGDLITEERGSYIFQTKIGEFKLKGKADRIEILDEGHCGIVDYKTASMPNRSEVEKGIKPQLQLLGLIAELGEFEKVNFKKVNYLRYLKLANSSDRGLNNLNNVNNLINDAEKGLKKLIDVFENPNTPYLFNPWRNTNSYKDYHQLARYDLWMDKI